MIKPRPIAIAALLVALGSLGACSGPPPSGTDDATAIKTSRIQESLQEARREVRTHVDEDNITLSAHDRSLPKAEITPAGDLLVDGNAVQVDANQRALLVRYRAHIADLAVAGADIGIQGAELATKAMGEALRGVVSGETDGMDKRIEAEAEKIEVQARLLCERMPAMLQTQQALAQALPEFRPYATMDADDIRDCRSDVQKR